MIKFSKKDDRVRKCFEDHHHSVAECLEDLEQLFKVLFSESPDRHEL